MIIIKLIQKSLTVYKKLVNINLIKKRLIAMKRRVVHRMLLQRAPLAENG